MLAVGTTADSTDSSTDKRQKRISLAVFFATCVASILALYLIYMRARKLWPLVVAEKAQRDHLKFLEEREDGRVTEPLTKQQVGDVVVIDGHAAAVGVGAGQDGHRRDESFDTDASDEYARREFEREKNQRRGDMERGHYTGTPTQEKAFYPPATYEQANAQHPYALKPGTGAMAGVGANGNGRHNFPTEPSAASVSYQQRAAMDSHASDLGGTTLVDRSTQNATPVRHAGDEYGRDPYGQGAGQAIPSGSFAEIPLTSQGAGGRGY